MASHDRLPDMNWIKRFALTTLVGVLAGISSALFLIALDLVTQLRESQFSYFYFLPVAGLIIGWTYHKLGREAQAGNNLILDEIHDPKKVLPFRMAPLIFLSTLLTHLVGGSAGREGTAIQMAASLGDQLQRFFKLDAKERKALLVSGLSAGFSSALGVPIAGGIFGMEVLRVGGLRPVAAFQSFAASFVAFAVCHLLRHHGEFPNVDVPHLQWQIILGVVMAGFAFGAIARLFIHVSHLCERLFRMIPWAPIRPAIGGLLLLLLFSKFSLTPYAGLGIPEIMRAFTEAPEPVTSLYKLGLTALTLGSGFKGGEFTPLVFIGVSLGSALSPWLGLSSSFLAGLGYSAVFGAAANTPLACAVMSAELFGWEILPYSLLASYIAHLVSPTQGIYSGQKQDHTNHFKAKLF